MVEEPAVVEEAVVAEAVTMTADAVASAYWQRRRRRRCPRPRRARARAMTDPEGDDEEQAPVVKQKQRVDYYRMVALVRRQIDSVRALDPVPRRCWPSGRDHGPSDQSGVAARGDLCWHWRRARRR